MSNGYKAAFNKTQVMLNKDLQLKSDYFPFLSKKKNNKQLLPPKLNSSIEVW
jgi:hypothetical protein